VRSKFVPAPQQSVQSPRRRVFCDRSSRAAASYLAWRRAQRQGSICFCAGCGLLRTLGTPRLKYLNSLCTWSMTATVRGHHSDGGFSRTCDRAADADCRSRGRAGPRAPQKKWSGAAIRRIVGSCTRIDGAGGRTLFAAANDIRPSSKAEALGNSRARSFRIFASNVWRHKLMDQGRRT